MATPWRTVFRFAAWVLLLALAEVTIAPKRPHTLLPTDLERIIAWACAGAIFAMAYVDRLLLVLLMLVGTAGSLELAQIEAFQRHARLSDFLVKVAGGLIGIGSVRAVQYLRSAK
jgi:hypothetical protein